MSQKQKIDPYWVVDSYYTPYARMERLKDLKVKDVTCKEDGCRYKPDQWCDDPKKAYRSHLKRKHRDVYYRTLSKPFIVREEDDIVETQAITQDLIRELLNA